MTNLEQNKEITNKNIRIDVCLLREALENMHVNELAFFYFLKFHFVNGRIYKKNNPINKVATLSGYSERTVFRRFQALKNLNLLSEDKGAYILRSTPRNSKIRLNLNIDITPKEIKNLLYLESVKTAARGQVKYQNIKSWVETGEKYQVKRKPGVTFAVSLSNRYAAKLLNITVQTAFVLFQKWEEAGLIVLEKPTPKFVMRCDPEAVKFLENNYKYRYLSRKTDMWEMAPQKIIFSDPVITAPITKKRWLRYRKDSKIRQFVNNLNREQWLKTA